MEDKFVLKPCPHCGGEATLASPDQWSYLRKKKGQALLKRDSIS